jgi:hypothetical protein
VANTNVYLSSSTIGTNTGPDGKYVLANIRSGVFQLVASRVGYKVESKSVQITQEGTLRVDFSLPPVTLQGEEVQVLAHVDSEWRRLLADFGKAFIGEGPNAGECALLNPEVLDFKMDRGSDLLVASTDSVLRIDNRALGYKLYARLSLFEWDVAGGHGRFMLYPRFEPLQSGDSAAWTRWRLNRERSYSGSLKHFLASLVAGTLEQEHFLVHAGALADLRAGASRPLAADDITLLPAPGQPLWKLTFDKWLRVDYRGNDVRLQSFIGLNGGSALVDDAGNLVDPLGMEVIGDWTKYRVADMLPLN